jgi:hypothetical protein
MTSLRTIPARTAYRLGVALAAFTTLLLVWGVGALGIIGDGEEDGMYLAVPAVLLLGTAAARLRARGMAAVLAATAAAQVAVTLVAFGRGLHETPGASIGELLMINGFYVALWLGAAALFLHADETPTRARLGAAAH